MKTGSGARLKVRRGWGDLKPFSRLHSTKKGKKGYDRRQAKKDLRKDLSI
jgi:hypothetical protein